VTVVFVDELAADGAFGFFSSGTWDIIRNLAIFLVAVFWVTLAVWVYKDARRRVNDPWLVGMAALLGLVPPFLGALIYLLLRPPEYLEEVRERELEIRAMEARLATRDLHCPVCRAQVEATFLVCPVCTTKLKQACVNCKAPLEALWQVCPYCETPVEAPPADLGRTQWLEQSRPRRERRRAE
jgi:Double zinc ribbon